MKTIKYECLNQFVIFGERYLRHLIKEFVEHYMTERFYQGIGGQLIRNVGPTNDNGAVARSPVARDSAGFSTSITVRPLEPRRQASGQQGSSFEHDVFVLIWPFGPPAERADVRTVGFPWYPGAVVEPSAPW